MSSSINPIKEVKMSKTRWFFKNSKQYMAGEKPSPYQWVRAYVRFMWFSRNDRR